MDPNLLHFLEERGATRGEIDVAEREGWLTLLTIDRALFGTRPRYNLEELAAIADTDPAVVRRLWRALGFPDVATQTGGFTYEDADALVALKSRLDRAMFSMRDSDPLEDLVRQVRAIGAGLARVAETLSDDLAEAVRQALASGLTDAEIAGILVTQLDWPTVSRLNDYALRLQMRDAVWRKLVGDADGPDRPEIAIGFLDLVGYTALSQELDESELTELVDRFEALTQDAITTHGARVVKTIGDEVMFVANDAETAVRVAIDLAAVTTTDSLLPGARAGVACGPVLAREGDYYGPVVNLAHRLVEIARPGTVIVPGALRDAIADRPGLEFSRLRPRRLRDIGRVEAWAVRGVVTEGETAASG